MNINQPDKEINLTNAEQKRENNFTDKKQSEEGTTRELNSFGKWLRDKFQKMYDGFKKMNICCKVDTRISTDLER